MYLDGEVGCARQSRQLSNQHHGTFVEIKFQNATSPGSSSIGCNEWGTVTPDIWASCSRCDTTVWGCGGRAVLTLLQEHMDDIGLVVGGSKVESIALVRIVGPGISTLHEYRNRVSRNPGLCMDASNVACFADYCDVRALHAAANV